MQTSSDQFDKFVKKIEDEGFYVNLVFCHIQNGKAKSLYRLVKIDDLGEIGLDYEFFVVDNLTENSFEIWEPNLELEPVYHNDSDETINKVVTQFLLDF